MTTTQTNDKNFELSYYIAPIGWNGKEVTFDPIQAENEFRDLHDAGIKWAGLNGVNVTEKINFNLDAAVNLMKEWMKKYDIRISSFHFAGITATNIGDSQTQIREHMRKSVEAFSPLEPNAFVIHAGWLQGADNTNVIGAWQNIVHKHGEEALVKHIADNFKEMIKMLSDLGIYAAFETMGKFFPLGQRNNIEMLMEFIDEKNTGYCLDSGHIHACGESVAEWIKLCGNRIFETHFHDNHARAANISGEFVPSTHEIDEHRSPGFGTIPWIDVIDALRDINFAGPVTFETAGWPGYPPVEGYKHAIEWWRTAEKMSGDR